MLLKCRKRCHTGDPAVADTENEMLFAAQSMMFQAAAGLVAAPLAARSVERVAAPSMAVGLVYSTTTGNTETVAGYIAGETGLSAVDIADLTGEGVAAFDGALRLSDYPASHLPAWPGPACSAVDAAELPASMLCRPHRWRAHLAHRRGLRALGHRVGRVRATPCCLSFPAPLVGRSLIRTRSRAGSSTVTSPASTSRARRWPSSAWATRAATATTSATPWTS